MAQSLTVIKLVVPSLPLDEAPSPLPGKFHPSIPCLFLTSHIIHADSSLDAIRYHNGSLTNRHNFAKRLVSASLKEKRTMMTTSHFMSLTSRGKHSARRNAIAMYAFASPSLTGCMGSHRQ